MRKAPVLIGIAIGLGIGLAVLVLRDDSARPPAESTSSAQSGPKRPAASSAPPGGTSPAPPADQPRVRVPRPARAAPVGAATGSEASEAARTTPALDDADDRQEEPAERARELQKDISVCLKIWNDAEPDREGALVLRLQVEPEGLVDAWAEDQDEVPPGVVDCLGDAVWKHDWSGVSEMPMDLTVPFSFAPDAP